MHISLIALHTPPNQTPGQKDAGGMNVVIFEAAKALQKLGHEVTVFTRASSDIAPGKHPLDTQLKNGPWIIALEAGEPSLKKEQLAAITGDFAHELSEQREFKRADVVHSHYWLSGITAHKAAKLSGHKAKHFITLHTVAAQKNSHLVPGGKPEPVERLESEHFLTQNMRVVAVSHGELDAISSGYAIPPEATVVHPGVDTALFKPSTKPKPEHTSALQITVLGRVQPFKGQDLALAAFADFVSNFTALAKNARLTIAGTPTPGTEDFYQNLHTVATAAHLTGKVRFLPALSRQEAARLLASSDIVLVPSHSETFGLVALEAAASGAVVLATDTSGLRESVDDGGTGFLIVDRSPKTWSTTIAALAADPHRLSALKTAAVNFALKHSWHEHAKKLLALYKN